MSTDPDSQPQAASPEQEGPPVEHDDGPRIVWPFDPRRPLLLALTVLATIFAVLAHLGIGLLSLFSLQRGLCRELLKAHQECFQFMIEFFFLFFY